jgi:hypothetical protein
MRRISLLVATAFASLLVLAAAPRDAHALGYGVRAGLHLSNLTGTEEGTGMKFGFQGGVAFSFPAGPVTIAPELLYVSSGYTNEIAGNRYRATLGYAMLEGLVRIRIVQKLGVHAVVGPRVGYLLTGNVETPAGSGFTRDDWEDLSYGFTVGAGIAPGGGFLVQLRYSRDLNDAYLPTRDTTESNQLFALVGGFSF